MKRHLQSSPQICKKHQKQPQITPQHHSTAHKIESPKLQGISRHHHKAHTRKPQSSHTHTHIYIYIIYPPTPEAPGTPQGEAVGHVGSPQSLLGSWQACLFSSSGLPKATLSILDRHQTLPSTFKPSSAPLAYSCTAALPSSRQLAGVPLLFLWASESDVRHFGPASNAPQRLWPTPASQPHRSLALFSAAGRPASESDVRHFGPPSNPPQRLQTLPSAFGLLLRRSLALFSAAGRPASSLLMGFRKRR